MINNHSNQISKCLICDTCISPIMSFGKMPLANGFLPKNKFYNEYFFELKIAICSKCNMFQLIDQPEPKQMFNSNYAFFSGTSNFMAKHFQNFSEYVISEYLTQAKDPFVVEIGSNDGIMLNNFSKKGIRHLGIEPSANVANVALNRGIKTIIKFFDKTLVENIVIQKGQADVVIAANVMCHIPSINSIIEAIKVLLKPEGVIIFEDPYLLDVIQKTTYDQIYDEHTFLFSVHSIQYLFNKFGMEIIDLEHQETHGGSMRYIIAHKGEKLVKDIVQEKLELEREFGLTKSQTYEIFRQNCEKYRFDLLGLLNNLKAEGKIIAGYAATSKSTTIINYCGITYNHLDCIYDTTPIKHGKFSPGAHIPIVDHSLFKENYPDYALLFGYNHEKEIMSKEQDFITTGGKWITYVPKVRVIS